MTQAPIASVEGCELLCVRGGHRVFRDLSFRVSASETLVIEGANGAGKTSLLRILAGLLQPRSGSILFRTTAGRFLEGDEERSAFVGWIGQLDGIKPQLSAREYLHFFCRYHRQTWDVDDLCARVGLTRVRNLPAQYFSAGQRKRLALARLIATARPLWLLDEPFVSLDGPGRDLLGALIASHCAQGGISIMSTHELAGPTVSGRLTLRDPQ